jgi:hypothetical protein
MLCLILIDGGLLIMMGQHDRSEALFYYFRLEDQVPETHLLRLIERHVSFAFVREKLKDSYSETGRPSIDPELLLRILLIGYLYGMSSERKLVEELRMHLAWRWFTGLGLNILDSAPFEQARTLPEACQPREFRDSCHRGCAGRRRLQGALLQPDCYCPVIRGEKPYAADSYGRHPRSAQSKQFLHYRRDCKTIAMRTYPR